MKMGVNNDVRHITRLEELLPWLFERLQSCNPDFFGDGIPYLRSGRIVIARQAKSSLMQAIIAKQLQCCKTNDPGLINYWAYLDEFSVDTPPRTYVDATRAVWVTLIYCFTRGPAAHAFKVKVNGGVFSLRTKPEATELLKVQINVRFKEERIIDLADLLDPIAPQS